MVDISSTGYAKLARVRTIIGKALNNNPYDLPVMTTPPTVAASASSDGTLGTAVPLCTAGVLTAAASRVAFYGGVPTPFNAGKYILMPVASTLPAASSGNLNGFAGGSITGDMQQWAPAIEFMTDATVVEIGIYMNSSTLVMLQVDGQYVDKTGTVGAQAGLADNFLKLTFATRKVRRIRALLGGRAGGSGNLVFQLRLTATCTFWKPDQSDVLRMAWASDSYGEGQATAYLTPNSPMSILAGELLGIRDVRQVSVGGTGYVNTGTGRSKLADQIPRWITAQAPFDLFLLGAGYNDYSTPSSVQAEVASCLSLIRASSSAPIVVLGAQSGIRNNDAGTLAVETAISAAVTAAGDRLCKFAPVSSDPQPWLFGTGKVGTTNGSGNSDFYVDPDGTHPSTTAGHEHLAYRAAAAIRTAVAAMG